MRYLHLILLCAALLGFTSLAVQADEACQNQSELAIVGKHAGNKPDDFLFQMGESLQIKATGNCLKKIQSEWSKTQKLTLYFDGERIADLVRPPLQVERDKELLLMFDLIRDAESDASRLAWDRLFKKHQGFLMTIQPALAIGDDLPFIVPSAQPFRCYVATDKRIYATLIAGLALLIYAYWYLAVKTKMLCDAGSGVYSLGKSQMAFWGLLVILSFTGIWFLTGTMERIPPQALILLGISGGTGLIAVIMGDSKKTETQSKLTLLRQEEQILQDQQVNTPDAFSPANQERLAAIKPEIGRLSKQLEAEASKGFWQDICDDGNGASFHRLQVVIWTLVLGAVFVHSVVQMMSMPEFPQTLLTLLGISNATYLGFKIPEKS